MEHKIFGRWGVATLTLVWILLGYAALASYTWPMGFVPVVSLEALPILLAGVLYLVFLTFGICAVLSAPFLIARSNFLYIGSSIRDLNFSDLDKEQFIEILNKTPIRLLFKKYCRSKQDRRWLVFGMFQASSIVLICCLPWALFSWIAHSLLMILFAVPLTYILFKIFVSTYRKERIIDAMPGLIFLFFAFIVYPIYFPIFSDSNLYPAPNVLVAGALKLTGLGGGRYATTISMDDSGQITVVGRLQFFDGTKAWMSPCDSENGTVVQVVPTELIFQKSNPCVKSNKTK